MIVNTNRQSAENLNQTCFFSLFVHMSTSVHRTAALVACANIPSNWSHSTVNLVQLRTGKGQRKWRICGRVVPWQIPLVCIMNFALEYSIADWAPKIPGCAVVCMFMVINCNSETFGRQVQLTKERSTGNPLFCSLVIVWSGWLRRHTSKNVKPSGEGCPGCPFAQ